MESTSSQKQKLCSDSNLLKATVLLQVIISQSMPQRYLVIRSTYKELAYVKSKYMKTCQHTFAVETVESTTTEHAKTLSENTTK